MDIERERERRMKKRTTQNLYHVGMEESMKDDSYESLVDQEDCPDCLNAHQCCLYLSGSCDGLPKNCPDFDD